MSKKGWRNGISVSLKSHRKSYSEESQKILFWWTRSPRTSWTKSWTSYSWWNSVQRKFYLTEYNMEIQNLKGRNSEYALTESQSELESQRHQLLEANQSKLNVREYICSRLEMKDHLHQESYTRSCREIEALRIRCYQGEILKKQRRSEEFPMEHDQESRTVSLLRDQVRKLQERLEYIEDTKIFQDPDPPSSFGSAHVPHQALIASSSRKLSREVGMLRNTREDMSIPGNVSDRQHAQRDSDELYNYSRHLATPSGIADDVKDSGKEGLENSGSGESLHSIPLPCSSVRERRKSLDDI